MRTSVLVALVVMCSALACSDSGDGGGAQSDGGAGSTAGPGDARVGNDDADSGSGGADSSGTGGGSGRDAADSSPRDSGRTDADSDRSADGDSQVDLDARDGSSRRCGGATCTATQVCVAYRVVGGAALPPDDAGNCGNGRHLEPIGGANGFCFADFAYQCVELFGCVGTPVTCACANTRNGDSAGTCPVGFPACSDPQPRSWLDPAAQLICELQVP